MSYVDVSRSRLEDVLWVRRSLWRQSTLWLILVFLCIPKHVRILNWHMRMYFREHDVKISDPIKSLFCRSGILTQYRRNSFWNWLLISVHWSSTKWFFSISRIQFLTEGIPRRTSTQCWEINAEVNIYYVLRIFVKSRKESHTCTLCYSLVTKNCFPEQKYEYFSFGYDVQ